MNEVAYVAAVALAAVFAWAGGSKLLQPGAAADAMRGLGVPVPTVVARALPLLELTTAAVLLTLPSAGARVALVLLTAFTVVLAAQVRAGTAVACGCLGTASTEPISAVELVRNGLLAALAVVALFATRPRTPTLGATITVTTAVATGALVVGLVRLRRDAGAVWSNRQAREGAAR